LFSREAALVASSLATGFVVCRLLEQRKRRAEAELAEKKAVSIDTTGLKPAFAKRVLELVVFKERFGHCDVPLGSKTQTSDIPKGLGQWVYAQRKKKAENKLDSAEEAMLKSLDFRWQLDPDELDTDELLEKLAKYKAEHGDTLVPKKYERDPLLGAWVCACRRKADPLLNGGKSMITDEFRATLDAAGFSWEPARRCGSSFMTGFRKYSEALAAGEPVPDEAWCEATRESRRLGKLSDQRIAYMDKFGFEWNL